MLATIAVAAMVPRAVQAQESAPAPAAPQEPDVKKAAAEYEAGRLAYQAKRYADAAMHFEAAYVAAPRAEALRNAIRTRNLARELDRAATLAVIAERSYAADGPTMVLVRDVLGEANVKLGRVDIECAPACTVKVDGVSSPVDMAEEKHRVYVKPGTRSVEARFAGRGVQATSLDLSAGSRQEWKVEPLPEEPKVEKPAAGSKDLPAPAPAHQKPLPKGYFFIGAALSAIGAGTTIAFYLDQKRVEREEVAASLDCSDPDCPDGSVSKKARRKTYIMGGVTAGLLLGTGVVGLFFTRWTSSDPALPARASMRLQPMVVPLREGAALGLSGRF